MSDDRYGRTYGPQGDRDPGGRERGDAGYRDDRGGYGGGQGMSGYDRGGADRYGGDRSGADRYGARDYGNQRYGQRDRTGDAGRGTGERYGGSGGYDRDEPQYHGSYASDGRRFEDVGRYRHADDDRYHDPDARYRGRPAPGGARDRDERGFFERAGDEIRSWFGDDEAERRRERDRRWDEQHRNDPSGAHGDHDYHHWRSGQIDALDRDYHEYRQENRTRFANEFASWRTERQGQRDLLDRVDEHMEVVGSDDTHVGTVDKVRGDRIVLTRDDRDAGGHHHSIPSRWLASVEGKVVLTKSAAEAKQAWRDEERQAMPAGSGHRGYGYAGTPGAGGAGGTGGSGGYAGGTASSQAASTTTGAGGTTTSGGSATAAGGEPGSTATTY